MARIVHQLLHTLSYGDAISGEVLAMQRSLKNRGIASEIYAINVHPRYKGLARDYRELLTESAEVQSAAEVVLHYSLGSPLNNLYLTGAFKNRYLVYHNITPSKWFAGVNPRIVADIEVGIRELPQLCSVSTKLLADSRFNAQELEEKGFQAEVLELPIDPTRWQVRANEGIASLLRSDSALQVLHVGRLAPNKRIEDILKVFFFLHHYICPNSKLWLAGIDIDTELYSFNLRRFVRELSLENAVMFTGAMSDEELRALYENSSVYLCMSEHEGFCLPVLEAMHYGLPVVSYDGTALRDTVGSGGVLFSEKRFAELAVLLFKLGRPGELRSKMISAGREWVGRFTYERFNADLQRIIG